METGWKLGCISKIRIKTGSPDLLHFYYKILVLIHWYIRTIIVNHNKNYSHPDQEMTMSEFLYIIYFSVKSKIFLIQSNILFLIIKRYNIYLNKLIFYF